MFPAGVLGYVLATFTTPLIQTRKGRRGIAVISSACRLLFVVILSSQPIFPVFLVSLTGLGYGTGLTGTAWIAWASSSPRPNVAQGILNGSFALGCVVGPAIVTFALRAGGSWCPFYGIFVSTLDTGLTQLRTLLDSCSSLWPGVSTMRGAHCSTMGVQARHRRRDQARACYLQGR